MREKLAIAQLLHEAGLALMRQRLAREHPDDPEAAERAFARWLHREDDPIPGDVSGPVRIVRALP